MSNRLLYLRNKLKTLRGRFTDNEQLWFELMRKTLPPDPPDNINELRTVEVYEHVRSRLEIELLFLQLEIELLKLGNNSSVSLEDISNEVTQ